MKKYMLYLSIVIFNIATLSANQSNKIEVRIICSDPIKKELTFVINSNKLNLTEDAMQDNQGGYVDIPATNYYLKTKDMIYHLDGVVEKKYNTNTNQFSSYINNKSKKLINIKKLYSLKKQKNIKFIQTIILEKNNKITTKNILNIYFNASVFNDEYKKCE